MDNNELFGGRECDRSNWRWYYTQYGDFRDGVVPIPEGMTDEQLADYYCYVDACLADNYADI